MMKIFKSSDPSVLWLVGISLVVYANSLLGEFQFDDYASIVDNPHVSGGEIFIGHLDHMVRPVLYGTFLWDRFLFADSAWGYHFINIGLHLVSGLLVYWIVLRARTDDSPSIAFWTAIIFLVHPLTTETVTYLSGRASGLMTCFYLLAFLLYLKGTEEGRREAKHKVWFIAAMVAFLLAMASKETAVTFPLALLLWDILVRRLHGRALGSLFLSCHVPFWSMVLVMAVALWLHPRYVFLADFSLGIRPIFDNVLSQVHAVAYALLLFFAPWKQTFDHDLPLVHSILQWPLLLDLMVLCGLIVGALVAMRRLPLVAFGVGWFFLHLLPTNSIIPRNDLLSERNLYLPSMGVFIVVMTVGLAIFNWVFRATSWLPWVRTGCRSIGLAWILVLCFLTVQRNALYQDSVLLWSDTVHKSPQKARPHNNLGHAYALQGDWTHAIEEFRVALTLQPDYVLAQENLREAYLFHVGRDK
ncbi:MAG: tetratricopeptide repeat protein [Nitrospirota bacterium]|nr:tetratricopeptide repeat protein [Nitrospirota bacterium]